MAVTMDLDPNQLLSAQLPHPDAPPASGETRSISASAVQTSCNAKIRFSLPAHAALCSPKWYQAHCQKEDHALCLRPNKTNHVHPGPVMSRRIVHRALALGRNSRRRTARPETQSALRPNSCLHPTSSLVTIPSFRLPSIPQHPFMSHQPINFPSPTPYPSQSLPLPAAASTASRLPTGVELSS